MAPIPAGLFIHHVTSPRIEAHFERLRRETAGVVDWYRVFNPGNWVSAQNDFGADAESFMPKRFERMRQNAGVQNGFLDTIIFPCAASLNREFVWVIEYDVDFAGDWADFFSEFANNKADLITSQIRSKSGDPQWYHWRAAQVPESITDDRQWRAFHPAIRLSGNFIRQYPKILEDENWHGHYELILPTMAFNYGFMMEDLGGSGEFTPPDRKGKVYDKASFKWRPSRESYFFEQPNAFDTAGLLYHPVKPQVSDWHANLSQSPATSTSQMTPSQPFWMSKISTFTRRIFPRDSDPTHGS